MLAILALCKYSCYARTTLRASQENFVSTATNHFALFDLLVQLIAL